MTIEIKVATTQEEVEAAFFLWMRNYQEKGYLPSSIGFRIVELMRLGCITKWNEFKEHNTGFVLVVKDGESVVGTLTVEFDSDKLPVADLFPEVINKLRATSSKLVYFGSFAIKKEQPGISLLVGIFRKLDELLKDAELGICVVNPCHLNIYRRMGFVTEDERENMPGLHNAKAILMSASAATMRSNGMWKKITRR
jgi:hypothetical protein